MEHEPETKWTSLAIVCPSCGNRGHHRGGWRRHASVPFRVIEEVVRSFEFSAARVETGKLSLMIDTDTDSVDWEGGTGFRFECTKCYHSFSMPEDTDYDFV